MLDHVSSKKLSRDDPRFLSSAARGLSVIECLAGAVGPRSLTELSQDTGLTIPTLQRLTSTLVEAGYIARPEGTKRYGLTVKTLDLLYYFLSRNAFAKSAWPHMVRLRDRVQLDVSLSLPLEQSMIFLHRLPGLRGNFESTLPGRLAPMYASASGHCLLAAQSDAEIDAHLNGADALSAADRAAWRGQILESRARGYGLRVGTGPLGVITLACPVMHTGAVIAGVSVHVPHTVLSAAALVDKALAGVSLAAASLST